MEALTSSSMKLLVESSRSRAIFIRSCSSRAGAIRFFQSQERNFLRLAISAPLRLLHRVNSVSSESQADVGATEDLIHSIDQSSTVRVKFKLHKECLFGEQFFLVGDDASFGVWDPENAIPLEWSDGHIWIAELDIPIGKAIQFKFILKGATGKIVWQPGPDRVLQTWETKNLIVISEDWDNAEIQKITEEELMVTPNSKLFVEEDTSYSQEKSIDYTDKKSIVADNITFPNDELTADLKNTPENISSLTEETRTDAHNELTISENKPYSDGNTKEEETSVVEGSLGSNGPLVTEMNPENEYNMNSKSAYDLVDYEGEPVLIPGLTPFPTPTTMGFSVAESSAVGASVGDDEAERESPDVPENHTNIQKPEMPEPKEKFANQHQEGKSVIASDEGTKEEANVFVSGLEETNLTKEQEQPNQQTSDPDVLENDIRWGRKTLRRLLANLGLL